jgi:hypothetical protein
MPENPTLQNPDWNADGQPQADQAVNGKHDQDVAQVPSTEPDEEGGAPQGRDRPPADRPRGRSPWLGGG